MKQLKIKQGCLVYRIVLGQIVIIDKCVCVYMRVPVFCLHVDHFHDSVKT